MQAATQVNPNSNVNMFLFSLNDFKPTNLHKKSLLALKAVFEERLHVLSDFVKTISEDKDLENTKEKYTILKNSVSELNKFTQKRLKKINREIFKSVSERAELISTYQGEPTKIILGQILSFGFGTVPRMFELKSELDKKKNLLEKFSLPANDIKISSESEIIEFQNKLKSFEEEKLREVDQYIETLIVENLEAVVLKEEVSSTIKKFDLISTNSLYDHETNKKLNPVLNSEEFQKLKNIQKTKDYDDLNKRILGLQNSISKNYYAMKDKLKHLEDGSEIITRKIEADNKARNTIENIEYKKKNAFYRFKKIQITLILDNQERRIKEIIDNLNIFGSQIKIDSKKPSTEISLNSSDDIEKGDTLHKDLFSDSEEEDLSKSYIENESLASNINLENYYDVLKYQRNLLELNKKIQKRVVALKEKFKHFENYQFESLSLEDKNLLNDVRADFYKNCQTQYLKLYKLVDNANETQIAKSRNEFVNSRIEGHLTELLENKTDLEELTKKINAQFEILKKHYEPDQNADSTPSLVGSVLSYFWGSGNS